MMKKLLCTLLLTVISVGFISAQADVNLQGNGNDIADGSTTPLESNHTNFLDVELGSTFTRTFTIQNTDVGGSDLNLTGPGVAFNFGFNSQFSLDLGNTGTPITNVTPTTFDVIFTATTLGVANATVNVTTDDPDAAEQSYTFAITANVTVAAPDVNLQGNNNDIVDGSTTPLESNHTDFLDVGLGSSLTRTFTIQNTGGGDLNLTGPGIAFNFGSDAQFSLDLGNTGSPITNITPTTFDVNFTALTLGEAFAVVNVTTDDPDAAEQSYTFTIRANVTAAAPDVNLQGNGNDIIDGSITPLESNHTDFLDVGLGSSLTRTFTIQNSGGGLLNLTGPGVAFNFGSNSQFSLDLAGTGSPITNITPTTFDVVFTATTLGEAFAVVNVTTDDPDAAEQSYTFTIRANVTAAAPDVNLQGNGNDIADGSTTPLESNHTDFLDVEVGSSFTRTFTIQNTGSGNLNLTGPGVAFNFGSNAQFSIDLGNTGSPITNITPTTFDVTFTAVSLGTANAVINVTTDDPDVAEQSYTFAITANGIAPATGNQLLMTQYYEGLGPNDNWVEVKNISATATLPGDYFLVIFTDLDGTINGGIATNDPDDVTESVQIPVLLPGEVILFKRSGATLPTAANLGAVTTIETEVCSFTGNDILVITSTNEGGPTGAYASRSDILGIVGTSSTVNWGVNTALIKGCGTTELPETTYDASQYTTLTLDEVNDVSDFVGFPTLPNRALGIQTVGPTIWNGSTWDNGLPGITKQTIINGNYSATDGSFESCDLVVNAGFEINMNGSTTNYVFVDKDLIINGTFTIGDTESLIMTTDELGNDGNISGQISKIESTTTLNNYRDFTYWSSPVNTTIGSVFTGVDPNRIFQWNKPTLANGGGGWSIASGTMTSARGYISEAPIATPVGGQHTVTFTGTPHNGLIPIDIGFADDGFFYTDYNLIGNPYPSAIDIDKFILLSNNSEIRNNDDTDGTIYLWTHNTQISGGTEGDFTANDYATYNLGGGVAACPTCPVPTKNIGSGQAFMVLAKNGGTVFFENAMRLNDQNTQFFKSNKVDEEKDRLWLDMTSEQGAFNQILVGFFDEATDGVDRGYDGLKNNGGSYISFYSNIDDSRYAIQSLGSFTQSKEVTLGFDTGIVRTFKIAISKIEGVLKDEDVYLVDNTLNIVHDLKQGPYEFEITETGAYIDRFTLKFNNSVLDIEDLEFSKDFVVINEDNTLRIKANQEVSKLKVFDVLGRLLIDQEPNESDFYLNTTNIKKGTILILNATMQDGSIVSKKGIKY